MTRVTAVPTATGTRPVSPPAFPPANVTSMRCSAAPGDVLELLAAVGAEADVGAEVDVAAEEPAAFPAQPVSGATRISRPARAGRRWAGRIDTGRLRGRAGSGGQRLASPLGARAVASSGDAGDGPANGSLAPARREYRATPQLIAAMSARVRATRTRGAASQRPRPAVVSPRYRIRISGPESRFMPASA